MYVCEGDAAKTCDENSNFKLNNSNLFKIEINEKSTMNHDSGQRTAACTRLDLDRHGPWQKDGVHVNVQDST
jgi:hypothetical protein